MIVKNLSELIPVKQRAIIINFNTKSVTFLTLLSVLRYAKVPVLLIDCESTDGSFGFFKCVSATHTFDLMSAPLKTHGLTLDWIFTQTKDEQLLLIDSDLEILSDEIINFMNEHIDHSQNFGSGFLLESKFLKKGFKGSMYENSFLIERPWMPIVLFKTRLVKEAIEAGNSFEAVMVDNEFAQLPVKVPKIAKKFLAKRKPIMFRKRYFVSYPEKVFYDTGGKIYEYLRYKRLLFFVNLPEPVHRKYVTHFWGVTRNTIDSNDTGCTLKDINSIISSRLKSEYRESELPYTSEEETKVE